MIIIRQNNNTMKQITKSLFIVVFGLSTITMQSQTYGENILIIHDAVGKPDSTVVINQEIVYKDEVL